jgi:hypothetical protein
VHGQGSKSWRLISGFDCRFSRRGDAKRGGRSESCGSLS